ncbi:hypothetical protein [Bradyrhizobium sp. MOS002]|uniref:hypothetical protein n=1 Tax=Bradyrhizobium sp. MOS002 TaxID=2133947 RepID=UPI0011B28F21|nr:hypothetical protein [Bradyrhizobium sp. MOS002]
MSTKPELLIDRYVEWLSRGRLTGRITYVTRASDMPHPQPGAEWHKDKDFDAAAELRRRPVLKAIFTTAIKAGSKTVREEAIERRPAQEKY